MADIRLNVRGRIVKGRWSGQFVAIEDDLEGGGCLIVVEPDSDGKNGGDVWIEKSQIAKAFVEADWEIEWEPVS
jgi:hypothetical protein